jgi:hypothetical protein
MSLYGDVWRRGDVGLAVSTWQGIVRSIGNPTEHRLAVCPVRFDDPWLPIGVWSSFTPGNMVLAWIPPRHTRHTVPVGRSPVRGSSPACPKGLRRAKTPSYDWAIGMVEVLQARSGQYSSGGYCSAMAGWLARMGISEYFPV